MTCSNGRSSSARRAGRTRSSCQGVSPTSRSPSGRRQRVREDESALLGEPQRRLHPSAAVIERDEAAGELGARLDGLQLGLRDVLRPEEPRPEGAGAVALDEEVDIADMVGLEHDRDSGRLARRAAAQTSSLCGSIASSTATSPSDSTHVDQTFGPQPTSGRQSGYSTLQTQRPGATSRISLTDTFCRLRRPREQRTIPACTTRCGRATCSRVPFAGKPL